MRGRQAKLVSMEEFVRGLEKIPRERFGPGAVDDYIAAYGITPESLRPYCYFNPSNYTRNLVFKNELLEVIAIGWEVGQVSRIHNHREQNCWMLVPIGTLENQNYRVLDRNPDRVSCRLEPSTRVLISPTGPLAVDPNEPVHQVLNRPEFGKRAVSIHIYSRPFNTCEVYSLEHGKYYDADLHYTSEYGKLCPGEKATRVELT